VSLEALSAELELEWDGFYPGQAALDADLAAGVDPDVDGWYAEACPNCREPPDESEDDVGPGRLCGCAMAFWTSGVLFLLVGVAGLLRRDNRVLI